MTFTEQRAELPLDVIWSHVYTNSDPFARGFLKDTKPVAVHDSVLILAVANDFSRDQVESRLRSGIEATLSEYLSRPISLAVTIDPNLQAELDEPEPPTTPAAEHVSEPVAPDEGGNRLNPKYTFDNFVPGESNRFAHAAAVAVAENPGHSYNPLMIYGESGLGKTHLLHAIGHYIRSYFPGLKLRYVSTEEMTNDFINAVSDNRMADFRRKYRDDSDVLLIDDIQFLEAKLQTQEEFFHTFNALHTAQKQIVLTSDRPPRSLEALEPRLRSRFEWGLMTDIQPPSLETRIAILRKKAVSEKLTADSEVLEFIASRIPTNIRELEGALIRVTAYANLNGRAVDLAMAQNVLKDVIPDRPDVQIQPQLIIEQVADYYTITLDEITGPSRSHILVTARQIAMYLCREMTDLSTPKIGQLFGGRDHTTVMHAVNRVNQMLSERRSVYDQVAEITNRIKKASMV